MLVYLERLIDRVGPIPWASSAKTKAVNASRVFFGNKSNRCAISCEIPLRSRHCSLSVAWPCPKTSQYGLTLRKRARFSAGTADIALPSDSHLEIAALLTPTATATSLCVRLHACRHWRMRAPIVAKITSPYDNIAIGHLWLPERNDRTRQIHGNLRQLPKERATRWGRDNRIAWSK